MAMADEQCERQTNQVLDQIWDSTDDTLAAELAQIGFLLLIDSIRIGTGDIDVEKGIARNPSLQAALWQAVEPQEGLRASVFLASTLIPLCDLTEAAVVSGTEALKNAYGSPNRVRSGAIPRCLL